jgi:hypothetical protein
VTISAINFDPDSTPIDSNISFLVVSYLSCFYIQRETDYKTTILANFATTTPLRVYLSWIDAQTKMFTILILCSFFRKIWTTWNKLVVISSPYSKYRLFLKHFSQSLRIFRNSRYRFQKQQNAKIEVLIVTAPRKLFSYLIISREE